MSKKLYTEEEKNFRVAQGIWENNNIIFNMIKDDIDHLITQRFSAFLKGHPKIDALCSKKFSIIADCKE
jgi:hypothetical protein